MGRHSSNLLFWQTLLAAEFSTARATDLVNAIGEYDTDPVSYLLTRAKLTESERKKVTSIRSGALEKAQKLGLHVLERSEMPERIRELPLAPPAVFCIGDSAVLNAPCVAIVGTRNATTYGKAVAQKFGEALAHAGVCVVSGGALGIDAAAHHGALQGGGKTVAVLACGVDQTYPPANKGLFDRIRENGCLLSQFAVGSTILEYKFLVRNDLIAALSCAVLVVEAPMSSGALRTASAAADLNRPVLVVPGAIDLINYRGSHGLIRDGATLVDHPEQVFEAIGLDKSKVKVEARSKLSELQNSIVEALIEGPLLPEKIVQQTGLEPAAVLAELTILEIEGHVIRDQGRFGRRP